MNKNAATRTCTHILPPPPPRVQRRRRQYALLFHVIEELQRTTDDEATQDGVPGDAESGGAQAMEVDRA